MEPHNLGLIFEKAILSGFWTAFKMVWWLFPLAIIILILEKWLNKKIDNWKRRNK